MTKPTNPKPNINELARKGVEAEIVHAMRRIESEMKKNQGSDEEPEDTPTLANNATVQPSDGAIRAAEELCPLSSDKPIAGQWKTEAAAIIDRETGVKELVEASNFLLNFYQVWKIDPSKSPNTMAVAMNEFTKALRNAEGK